MARVGSPFRRPPVFALVAIVLPAVIVAVLGYVSLRQWEAAADLLVREQARDVVAMAADKIEMVARRADDELLAQLEAALAGEDGRWSRVAALRASAPLLESLVLMDRGGRLVYPVAPNGEEPPAVRALRAEIPQGFWERGGRRDLMLGEQPILVTLVRGPGAVPLLAALGRNVEVLRREVFAKTLGGLEGPNIVAVVDARGRPVYSGKPLEGAEPVLTIPFRERFPGWGVTLCQPAGASPQAAVRRQVALFTAAFAVLLVVIGAGVVAISRLVRRETEMARLKADFVANVSHDLKTPLSVIRMFGETLELGRVGDEAARRDYYRVITREAERLSRLIDNVLDFSRIESGRRTYARIPTAVEPLVRQAVEGFSYPLLQQGFKVEVRVAPDLPEVPMDASAVEQALANLVDNAIKYSAERKALTVEARVADGGLALAVGDEGIGIPAAEHGRIFDKFYRVGRSETAGRRGSGVGLALVRHVAEAHGGRVMVESQPGTGSRFTLWLPLAAPAA